MRFSVVAGFLLAIALSCFNIYRSKKWTTLLHPQSSIEWNATKSNSTSATPTIIISSMDTSVSKIPRRLIFTHRFDILASKRPSHLYTNVRHTIEAYAKAWNQSSDEIDVLFLDDTKCRRLINAVEPRLVVPFLSESFGAYKSDICRVAALYVHGGYYFDCDLEVVNVLEPDAHIDFLTADMLHKSGQFYNAIIATPPSSPVLRSAMNSMLDDWYQVPSLLVKYNVTKFTMSVYNSQAYRNDVKSVLARTRRRSARHVNMGCITLRIGYDQHVNTTSGWILHEEQNNHPVLYPSLYRKSSEKKCNYIVHDHKTRIPYFYSRLIGTPKCSNSSFY
jgi:hypothetical protein